MTRFKSSFLGTPPSAPKDRPSHLASMSSPQAPSSEALPVLLTTLICASIAISVPQTIADVDLTCTAAEYAAATCLVDPFMCVDAHNCLL